MKLKFDVSLDEYKIINAILNEHLAPRCLVFVFGSRAKNTARFNSDLDLAIDSDKPLTQKEMVMLKDAFNESRLPYTVDVVDVHNIEKSFRDIIDSQKVVCPLSRTLSGVEGKGNVPELRFPEFSGEWVEKRLGEVTSFVNGKAHENEICADGQYIVVNSKYISTDGQVIKKTNSQISPIYRNDLVMVMSDVPNGKALAKCLHIKQSDTYTLNHRICALREKNSSNQFLFFQINRNKYFLAFDNGVGQTNLRKNEVLNCPVNLPSLPEQQKIADFLTSVDNKIQSLTQKKEALSRYKKGLLQKLFPGGFDSAQPPSSPSLSDCDGTHQPRSLSGVEGNGNVPEIRFPGFEGEWKTVRFGDVFRFISTNSLSRDSLTYDSGSFKNIQYGDIHKNFKSNFKIKNEKVPYIKDTLLEKIDESVRCQEGDLVIADASEDYSDIGKSIEIIDLNSEKLVAGLHTFIARNVSNNMALGFKGCLMQVENVRTQIKRIATGVSVLGISKKNLSKILLIIPSLPEQQKIADFLTTVDNKITQVDQQIEKMNQFKKGLLQQMFV